MLGSCVSVCLWDDTAKVGGMNHLVLAGKGRGGHQAFDAAGAADMELLINGLIKIGGARNNFQAKVFGGSNLLGTHTGIGRSNSDFVFEFLEQESIPCVNSSVGGRSARTMKFWPTSGRVSMRLVSETVPEPVKPVAEPVGNSMELFG